MHVLFDNGLPRGVASVLNGHVVEEARDRGWDRLTNGDVFVTSDTKKGTWRAGQEYDSPLLVLTGVEYMAMPFQDLHDRLCDALRGARPRLVSQVFVPGSASTLVFDDGSTVPTHDEEQEE